MDEITSRKRKSRGIQRKRLPLLNIVNGDGRSRLRNGKNRVITSSDTDDNIPGAKHVKTDRIRKRTKKRKDQDQKNGKEKNESEDDDELTVKINKKALRKEATTYELERFEKNVLVIFNQVHINGYEARLGTEKDVNTLQRTFENFGFKVKEHTDLTKVEILDELKKFGKKDFTDYGCVVVAVLTHGSNDGLLRAKDQEYSEIEIFNHLMAKDRLTLVTKPKIIIIQACRGKTQIPGVSVAGSSRVRRDHDEGWEPYILPSEADMLILHSSYIGSPSHRDELHGSWLIQSLCTKIDELAATHDLESIITEVKREVAIDKYHEEYNKRTLQMDANKQMPVTTSTLIRKLYLRRFNNESFVKNQDTSCSDSVESDDSISILNNIEQFLKD